ETNFVSGIVVPQAVTVVPVRDVRFPTPLTPPTARKRSGRPRHAALTSSPPAGRGAGSATTGDGVGCPSESATGTRASGQRADGRRDGASALCQSHASDRVRGWATDRKFRRHEETALFHLGAPGAVGAGLARPRWSWTQVLFMSRIARRGEEGPEPS